MKKILIIGLLLFSSTKLSFANQDTYPDPKDKNPELYQKIMNCQKHSDKNNSTCSPWNKNPNSLYLQLNKACYNSNHIAERYCKCMMLTPDDNNRKSKCKN